MITSFTELKSYMNDTMSIVLKNVMNHFYEYLLQCIDEEVYSYEYLSDVVNDTYRWQIAGARTGQFKDSWHVDVIENGLGYVQCKIDQEMSVMKWSENTFQHGSSSPLGEDGLNEIINDGKIGDAFNFPQIGARPFWTKFEQYVEQNLQRVFEQECLALGLEVSNFTFTVT